jgi:hypothetical protein
MTLLCVLSAFVVSLFSTKRASSPLYRETQFFCPELVEGSAPLILSSEFGVLSSEFDVLLFMDLVLSL